MIDSIDFATQLNHSSISLETKDQSSIEGVRVLTSDELSLKVVCMQSKIQEKIDRKLSSGWLF